jgi:hypothetical protein
VGDHQLKDTGGRGAERHPDANFGGALTNNGGKHSVKPDSSQQSGNSGKQADEQK